MSLRLDLRRALGNDVTVMIVVVVVMSFTFLEFPEKNPDAPTSIGYKLVLDMIENPEKHKPPPGLCFVVIFSLLRVSAP